MRNEQDERIVIDRSPPEHLSDHELRQWAADQKVFVSSVMRDMTAEREAVASAVEAIGATAVLFERFGGRDDSAEVAYLDGVRGSDIYVGVLGERYGIPDASGYAPTHLEYNEAVHRGLRLSVWTTAAPVDGRQQDFLGEVRVFHTTGSYTRPEDLASGVDRRLREIADQASSPWCKVGPALFRARRFTDSGTSLTVEAVIRDDDVVAALEALRPSPWGPSGSTRVTCAGRTREVRVDSVIVEATSGRGRRVQVEMTPGRDEGRSSMLEASFNGYSPDELTELALRVALFGEENPLGTMSFFAEMPNPLAVLPALQLTEDAVPAVAEVLLVEALVGSGRAERITALRLGPIRGGRRRLLLEWLAPRRFSNVEPQRRSVEGELPA